MSSLPLCVLLSFDILHCLVDLAMILHYQSDASSFLLHISNGLIVLNNKVVVCCLICKATSMRRVRNEHDGAREEESLIDRTT